MYDRGDRGSRFRERRRQLPETIVRDRTKLVRLVTRNGERGERDIGIWWLTGQLASSHAPRQHASGQPHP